MKRILLWVILGVSVATPFRIIILGQSFEGALLDLAVIGVLVGLFFTVAKILHRQAKKIPHR